MNGIGTWLRRGAIAAGLGLAIGLNALALAVGGWHFYRYVVAPRFDWVSSEQAWDEQMRMATSRVRRIEEREAALEEMLEMKSYARSLSEPARRRALEKLGRLVRTPDVPLRLKYKVARVQAVLRGEADERSTPGKSGAEKASAGRVTWSSFEEGVGRLRALVRRAATEPVEDSSAVRTRLVVELFRQQPCDPELLQLVRELAANDALPRIERGFVHGTLAERDRRCS